ncbi:flagellar hook-basal body protein [Desulfoglaeba alkanexedens]|uniref:Flagellar hook-basal body protein n=1 Tax=Desulfoglaeba alkanexedens ALDC TaxID=980445 RepID=A0A4P8L6G3_9BACT|nr:flagellar hook-basal body protein [Desulfoglaeba alkanexedens]QCQ22695.1 flagellar hook-basal body protein [Desulfoglaeba alkanexedens ALDC]
MRIGSQVATLGSLQQEKRLDVIANNLANANTPGFKKEGVRFEDFMFQETYSQYEQGPIRTTGNPLDVALLGKGFFRVQSPDGILYTRAGNLTMDAEGALVTQEGWPVLGQGGVIELTGRHVRIEPDGQIFDDGFAVDTLDLVAFPEGTRMLRVGGNGFRPADAAAAPEAAVDCTVEQGSLEDPNFSVVAEMTQLIETLRIFETYQKMSQTFHQEDTQLISKLGSTT